MRDVRHAALPLAVLIHLALAAPLRADDPLALDVTTRKVGDHAAVETKEGATTITVTSSTGIGGLTISPKQGQWPKKIVLRLTLRGLESLSLANDKVTLGASVTSYGDHAQRVYRKDGGQEKPLGKDDPYWMEIKRIDGGKDPAKKGYFELTLPEALFKDRPKSLTLDWIDFYR